MHGALIPLFNTRMAVPNPWLLAPFLGPVLVVLALWWLIDKTDRIINWLFPDLEWEKSLGWLNIKAERRAKTALRWVGYVFYLFLAGLLYCIVRLAEGFPSLENWPDPDTVGDLVLRLPAFAVCVGIWLLYLGGVMMPRIRREREEKELKKFRAEREEAEREKEMIKKIQTSRVKMALQKPRKNTTLPETDRQNRYDGPGG